MLYPWICSILQYTSNQKIFQFIYIYIVRYIDIHLNHIYVFRFSCFNFIISNNITGYCSALMYSILLAL